MRSTGVKDQGKPEERGFGLWRKTGNEAERMRGNREKGVKKNFLYKLQTKIAANLKLPVQHKLD